MMSRKYCLVQFVEDDILHVVTSKSTTKISKRLIWAPYKKFGRYQAIPLNFDDNKKSLEKIMQSMLQQAELKSNEIPKQRFNKNTPCDQLKDTTEEITDIEESRNILPLREGPEILPEISDEFNDDSIIDPDHVPDTGTPNGNFVENMQYDQFTKDSFINSDLANDVDVDDISSEMHKEGFDKNTPCDQLRDIEEITDIEKSRNILPVEERPEILPEISDESDDDSIVDPDYVPDTEMPNGKFVENTQHNQFTKDSIVNLDLADDVSCLRKESTISDCSSHPVDLNYKNLNITHSRTKKHFCKFCLKLQTKFARHLELRHKNEERVEYFLSFPKKNPIRLKIIHELRAEGDFLYNSQKQYNLDNELIVVRRPSSKTLRTAEHFKPCGSCGAMYSHLSLATHFRLCKKNRKKGSKDALICSKQKYLFISSEASEILRKKILPVLRDDKITRTICSDAGIILFGNRLAQKYRSPHLYKMIRSKLRCVASFFLTFKEISNNMSINFEELFDPQHYDNIILSINKMCGLNQNTGTYKSPATAFAIGSHLKKISFYLISEYIKKKAKDRQDEVKDFLQLLQEGLSHDVNKTVQENQLEQKRKKKISLPTVHDIQTLRLFLEKQRQIHMKKLDESFSYNSWEELLSVTLISLQLFNRRRAGEMERIGINDFLQYEKLEPNDELLNNLDPYERKKTENYVRFLIKGKLMRGVPVMVNKDNLITLKTLLKLRSKAQVDSNNKYLFGIPGDSHKHLSATLLMNRYSKLCGAQNPKSLRGTELRKHIATKCGTMNLGKTEVKDVADYLGHHEKIHLDYYRLPNAAKDIIRMSSILEQAQGDPYENSLENSSNDISNINMDCEDTSKESAIDFLEDNQDNYTNDNTRSHSNIQESCDASGDNPNKKNISRLSWTNQEKNLVDKEFIYYMENCEMPTPAQCNIFLEKEKLNRSIGQLRGYISNEIRKRKHSILDLHHEDKEKKVNRTRWTAEKKTLVFENFKKYFEEKKLPSLALCKKIIEQNNIIKKRSPEMLKAFVNNIIKKAMKN